MMDFLQRLAPRESSDRARAVAVLPSRFAESPLRESSLPASSLRASLLRGSRAIDAASPAFEQVEDAGGLTMPNAVHERPRATRVTMASADPAAMLRNRSEHSPSQDAPLAETSRRTSAREVDRDAPFREALAAHGARTVQDDIRIDDGRTSEAAVRSTSPSATARIFNGRDIAVHNRIQPLSEAAVAGRLVSEPRVPDEIVHVTIGRIDVVGDPRAAAPLRPSRPPRTPSVSLSDFLHGHP